MFNGGQCHAQCKMNMETRSVLADDGPRTTTLRNTYIQGLGIPVSIRLMASFFVVILVICYRLELFPICCLGRHPILQGLHLLLLCT